MTGVNDTHNCLDHLFVGGTSVRFGLNLSSLEITFFCGFNYCGRRFDIKVDSPRPDEVERVTKFQEDRTKVSYQIIDKRMKLIPSALAPPRYPAPLGLSYSDFLT